MCTPITSCGSACGALDDGCGGTLACGGCQENYVCGASVANQCGCNPGVDQLATLTPEQTWWDLDTNSTMVLFGGYVLARSPLDVQVAWNGITTVHSRLFQLYPLVIAALNQPYASVTACSIASATFTQELIDIPLTSNTTMLLRTDLGAIYKIGLISEANFNAVQLRAARLSP